MSDRVGIAGRVRGTTAASAVVVVGVLLLNLLQQPGRITFDTKLDLQFGPWDFMARSLSLWNPDAALGGLQNQASGYLFPMGPAFALGDELGVPMWVWQRLWSAAVMLLAYDGARRVARSWPGIGAAGAVVAGLAYMLSPRVLTTVGGLSGETLPSAVLPWTLLPLVLYLRGRLPRGPAFLLSVATLPWMGGQNATLVVACLLLPAVLLVLGDGRSLRRRVVDLALWGGGVVAACLWWLVPLLFLGGYAPPFLDFIESARNTATSTGWLSSFRGTSHWVAFFPGGGQVGWQGGYALASSRILLLPTVLVAAAGLVGLLRPGLWQRRALVVSVLVGLAVLTAGSGLWAGSVLSGAWLDALDTTLAPLRNIHKFDPLVRLPLCLGLGALLTGLPAMWRHARLGRSVPLRRVTLAAATLTVLAAAQPAATGMLRTEGGMTDIPVSWRDAVGYLDAQDGPVRALVLPGAGFANQVWGRTIDEPIQVLDAPPWLARAQVTVAPGGTLRVLDEVESSVWLGGPQADLAVGLRRMGITHVVVRHDLDEDQTDAPSPDVVDASVDGSSGLRRAASFGRSEGGGRPAVEVYAVDTSGDPRVRVQDWAGRLRVSGGPERVAELVSSGLVAEHQATELVDGEADVVTDSNRRVERSFGRVQSAVSAVMAAGDVFRIDRREHDFTDDTLPGSQTTAAYEGADRITASSSGGYADVLGPVRPEQHPYAAFDESLFTAWSSAPLSDPHGQWVEVGFGDDVSAGPVALQFDNVNGVAVRQVTLSTDAGSVEVPVQRDGAAGPVTLPEGETSYLRITVDEAAAQRGQVRLADVSITGHDITRTFVVPGDVTPSSAVHLLSERSRRACVTTRRGVACDQSRHRETPETLGFDRTLTVTEEGTWRLAARAVATDGPTLERLFGPLDDRLVSLTATSWFGGDPAVLAAHAFDGRESTSWLASSLDLAPALALSWPEERRITSVRATLGSGQPGRLPDSLLVDPLDGGEPQQVALRGPDAGRLEPFRTDRLRIVPVGGNGAPVGISELSIGGLDDLKNRTPLSATTGTVCGFGPTVEVTGEVVETRLDGTLEDVMVGRELAVVPCGGGRVTIPAGTHRVRVTNPAGFTVTSLWWRPTGDADGRAGPLGTGSHVVDWGSTERSVRVGASEEDVVLTFAESFNAGWSARLGDEPLEAVAVDGWKQGFVVPAGEGGTVETTYGPHRGYLVGLVGGLAVAALLNAAVLVLLVLRRWGRLPARWWTATTGQRPATTGRLSVRTRRGVEVATAVVLALVSLPLAAGAVAGRLTTGTPLRTVATGCFVVLGLAGLLGVVDAGSAVRPPVGSDLVAALVVGVVAGRVLGSRREDEVAVVSD